MPCGRPDVAYAVGILARCLTFPTVKLMECARRVLVYLAQNEQDGLHFDGNVPDADILHAYSDSNWTTGHSTTGFILMLAGVSICYSSKRHNYHNLASYCRRPRLIERISSVGGWEQRWSHGVRTLGAA